MKYRPEEYRPGYYHVSEALDSIRKQSEKQQDSRPSGYGLSDCFIPWELLWESMPEAEFKKA